MIARLWRRLLDLAYRIAPEGTVRWHVLTWCGHTSLVLALAALGGMVGLAPAAALCGAGYYTIREAEQWLLDGSRAPWWDRVGDVLGPWLVVWWAH